jgi:Na+-driven multidrug efflux pump
MARELGQRVLVLSLVVGVGIAAVLALAAPLVARVFTDDPAVVSRATAGLIVLAVLLVPGAVAFALDGVLIGAGDLRYLAFVLVVSLAVYLPFALAVLAVPTLGIVGVWGALLIWMTVRAVMTDRRFKGEDWMTAAF